MTTATASARGRANREKGAVAERHLVGWLRTHGWPHAERAVRTGYRTVAGQAVSAVTHYVIDRRWTLAWLADRVGKGAYHDLGRHRPQFQVQAVHQVAVPTRSGTYHSEPQTVTVPLDVAPAVTGAYSLDQSLHLAALFVSALLTALV